MVVQIFFTSSVRGNDLHLGPCSTMAVGRAALAEDPVFGNRKPTILLCDAWRGLKVFSSSCLWQRQDGSSL
jgi:hypothetical protein